MALAVRRALKVGLAAVLLTATVVAPAAAADAGSPDATYYRSSVSSVQPAVPGLDVRIGAEDGMVTLVNGTGNTVTVVGYANEPYLRITQTEALENTNALTSKLNASPSLDKMSAGALGDTTSQPPKWVTRSNEPKVTWRDYRVLWTNNQRPPIVAADPHSEHQVFTWALQMRVGSDPVLVLGEVRWTGTPWLSTVQLVLVAAVLVALAVVAFWFMRRRGTPQRGGGRYSPAPPLRSRTRTRTRARASVPGLRS